MVKKVSLLFLLGLLTGMLAACRAAATPDPAVVLDAVNTAVALTMEAQAATQTAQAAQATPTLLPTWTPLPTDTLAPTPTLIPPTVGVDVGGSGSGYTPPPPKCILLSQSPEDGVKLRPNEEFDVKWTLQNNSTTTWPQNADVTLVSGPAIARQSLVHLAQDVPPGGTVTILFDAVAPDKEGFYVSQWEIRASNVYCRPYLAFYVERP